MTLLAQALAAEGVGIDLPWFNEDGEELRLLWHSNYWDGVLSGMCVLNGREHWFECVNQDVLVDDSDPEFIEYGRLFAVVLLTDAEIAEEKRRHTLFQTYVGTHCDYTYEGPKRRRTLGAMVKDWAKDGPAKNPFYEQQKGWPTLDFKQNEVVGFWAYEGVTPERLHQYGEQRAAATEVANG